LGIIDDKAEQFTNIDLSIDLFVFAALHFEKGLVEIQQRDAKGDELLSRRSFARVTMI